MDLLSFLHLLNGLLMVGLPIGLGVYLTRKFHTGWRLWWLGALTFILSQIGHLPFNWGMGLLFQKGILPAPAEEIRLPFNAILLGLSAGVWEEFARYAAYRWWAKEAREWKGGLLLGAGHGGVEALILGMLVLYTYVQMVAIRNADLTNLIAPDRIAAVEQARAVYWSSPWHLILLGSLERFFAIILHLALSIMVLQAFMRGNKGWLGLAILWHAAIDAIAVFAVQNWGVYHTELILGLLTPLNLATIFVLRERPSEITTPEAVDHPTEPSSPLSLPPVEETPERIEQTRYN